MAKIQKFEDLKVWQDASDIAAEIYKVCCVGKLSKDYSLRDQLTRAAISISNNIAEGFEYDNNKDFIKFLRYAKGSTGEVRNIINFLLRIKVIDSIYHKKMTDELIILSKQLFNFIKYLRGNK